MCQVKNILLIDDEPALAQTLAIILRRAGYGVTTALSVSAALDCLQSCIHDLIFFDLKFTSRVGPILMPQLEQLRPDTPVLVLATSGVFAKRNDWQRERFCYLSKPIDPATLLDSIERLLALSKPERTGSQ